MVKSTLPLTDLSLVIQAGSQSRRMGRDKSCCFSRDIPLIQ